MAQVIVTAYQEQITDDQIVILKILALNFSSRYEWLEAVVTI
jgi:hypothetical protein